MLVSDPLLYFSTTFDGFVQALRCCASKTKLMIKLLTDLTWFLIHPHFLILIMVAGCKRHDLRRKCLVVIVAENQAHRVGVGTKTDADTKSCTFLMSLCCNDVVCALCLCDHV